MKNAAIVLLLVLAFAPICRTQSGRQRKIIPVYIDTRGVRDETGQQFIVALKRALSESQGHDLGAADVDDRRLQFLLQLVTIDPGPNTKAANMSFASITIEEMYRPNSYPVATMWYHKAFLLDHSKLDEIARQFVSDMDAHWCNYIKSSVGNCSKESIPHLYP